jgi:hypothetical protein
MSWLDRLPADVTFRNVQAVWDALGGMHEHGENVPSQADRVAAEETKAPLGFEAAVLAETTRARAEVQSPLERGTTVATEVAEVVLGAAAFVVGAVCESIRTVARRVQDSSG